MGEALAIIIAFAVLLGISWGVTCAAVWAICALMHWTFTWAVGTAAWIALWLIGSFGSSKKRGADHACTEETLQQALA